MSSKVREADRIEAFLEEHREATVDWRGQHSQDGAWLWVRSGETMRSGGI